MHYIGKEDFASCIDTPLTPLRASGPHAVVAVDNASSALGHGIGNTEKKHHEKGEARR